MDTKIIIIAMVAFLLCISSSIGGYMLTQKDDSSDKSSDKKTGAKTDSKKSGPPPPPPANPGEAISCKNYNPKGDGAIYRYEGDKKMRWYPNPDIAGYWDSKWQSGVQRQIDCTGITLGDDMPPPFNFPQRFMLQVPGKNNLCVDDGGGRKPGETKFHLWTCDTNNINQQFVYNPKTRQIQAANKLGLCVDDGGGQEGSQFHLWDCNPENTNQHFVYNATTKMFQNPNKNNLCIEDGKAMGPGEAKMQLAKCDTNSQHQRFESKDNPKAQGQPAGQLPKAQGQPVQAQAQLR